MHLKLACIWQCFAWDNELFHNACKIFSLDIDKIPTWYRRSIMAGQRVFYQDSYTYTRLMLGIHFLKILKQITSFFNIDKDKDNASAVSSDAQQQIDRFQSRFLYIRQHLLDEIYRFLWREIVWHKSALKSVGSNSCKGGKMHGGRCTTSYLFSNLMLFFVIQTWSLEIRDGFHTCVIDPILGPLAKEKGKWVNLECLNNSLISSCSWCS